MTNRSPVSAIKPIWFDSAQVDETDLQTEQTANDVITSSIINNHIGYGILPETLTDVVLFDSSLSTGFLDGYALASQSQPSDSNLGNQLTLTLTNSAASGHRRFSGRAGAGAG